MSLGESVSCVFIKTLKHCILHFSTKANAFFIHLYMPLYHFFLNPCESCPPDCQCVTALTRLPLSIMNPLKWAPGRRADENNPSLNRNGGEGSGLVAPIVNRGHGLHFSSPDTVRNSGTVGVHFCPQMYNLHLRIP